MGLSAWNSHKAPNASFRVSSPDNTIGYYRGSADGHRVGNQGSGQGSDMAGSNTTLNASNFKGSMGKWHPTVLWMLGLVLAEVFAMGLMRKLTKHGG
jgi:hypothetical protein